MNQLVFKNMTGIARYRIACTDEDAIYLANADDPSGVRVFTNQPGSTWLALGLGLSPEPYEVLVDDEKIDGTYVGLGGIVRWGFSEIEDEKVGKVWQARLMVPGAEDTKLEGEVYGFMKAGSP